MDLKLELDIVNPCSLCMKPNICHFCNKSESKYHCFISFNFGWILCNNCREIADVNLHEYCKKTKCVTYKIFSGFNIDFKNKIENVKFSIIRSSGEINNNWKVSYYNGPFIIYDNKNKEYLWEMTNGSLRKKISITDMRIINDNLDVDGIITEIMRYHEK